jgi:UDP-glucose 4-epimerase
MKKILVTGGAGFIGSHLVDRLIEKNRVIVLDNLSSGKIEFINPHFNNPNFEFYQVDLLVDDIFKYFENVDEVWHLAANSNVRIALKNTKIDIEQNILATHNVLEAVKASNVKRIIFTSSSTVYGEAELLPTPENYSPLLPISLYGASKLSCEALISAYCHSFGIKAVIFRLANIIGPRLTHGIIFDFVNKLKQNKDELEVLGDGNQMKSYLHLSDCIEAMLMGVEKSQKQIEIYNIGSKDWISVKRIAEIVSEEMGLTPKFNFTGEERGWKGDVPKMLLDISKIEKLGFKIKHDSDVAIRKSAQETLQKIN